MENAGYEIVCFEKYQTLENGSCYYIVLGQNPKSNMWVTWDSIDLKNFFWGHYYDCENHARIDYHQRLAYQIENQAF